MNVTVKRLCLAVAIMMAALIFVNRPGAELMEVASDDQIIRAGSADRTIANGQVYRVQKRKLVWLFSKEEMTHFCWLGHAKSFGRIWESAKVDLFTMGDDFTVVTGPDVSHVRYLKKREAGWLPMWLKNKIPDWSWSRKPIPWLPSWLDISTIQFHSDRPWKARTVSVPPFQPFCAGVSTAEDYHVQLVVRRLDPVRVVVFFVGLVAFVAPPPLPYLEGFVNTLWAAVKPLMALVSGGVLASFTEWIPSDLKVTMRRRTLNTWLPFLGHLVTSNTGGALAEVMPPPLAVAVVALVSAAAVALRQPRLLQWSLRAAGLLSMLASSDHLAAVGGFVFVVAVLSYVFETFVWPRRFDWREARLFKFTSNRSAVSPQTLSHDSSLKSQGASCSSDDRLSSRSSSGRPLDDNDTGICNVDVDVGHLVEDTVTPTSVSSSSSSSASAGGPVVALSSCRNAATAIRQSGELVM